MKFLPSVVVLATALLGVGCASMSADECLVADWQMIGYEDGANGESLSRLGNHRKACAAHGVTPDMHAYERGHDDGIRTYCVPELAFEVGKAGQTLPRICPAATIDGFVAAYKEGRSIYLDIRESERRIALLDKQIEELEEEISFLQASKKQANSEDEATSAQQRKVANRSIDRLTIELRDMQAQRDRQRDHRQWLSESVVSVAGL